MLSPEGVVAMLGSERGSPAPNVTRRSRLARELICGVRKVCELSQIQANSAQLSDTLGSVSPNTAIRNRTQTNAEEVAQSKWCSGGRGRPEIAILALTDCCGEKRHRDDLRTGESKFLLRPSITS